MNPRWIERNHSVFFYFTYFNVIFCPDKFWNDTRSDIKCTFCVTSLTCQSKLCNVMYYSTASYPRVYDDFSTSNQTWFSVCVFLWMGFYVYVFKNKYCCLMMDVDLLSIEAKLRVETWGVEMSMIVSTIYILNGFFDKWKSSNGSQQACFKSLFQYCFW